MPIVAHGTVNGTTIELRKSPRLRAGSRVRVVIEPVEDNVRKKSRKVKDLSSLAFFGMWRDRDDLGDSADWVRKEREKWNRRASRRELRILRTTRASLPQFKRWRVD